MRFRKKIKSIFLSILAFVILIFLLICGLFLVYFLKSGSIFSDTFQEERIPRQYQSLIFDPTKNTTSLGTISSYENVEGEDFLSYQFPDGKYHLISNFGTEEYQCSGYCWCENNERRSVNTIRKPIFYFVAALSSTLAIFHAKKHFEVECRKETEEKCFNKDDIFANVEGCDLVYSSKDYLEQSRFEYIRYLCTGECIGMDSIVDFTKKWEYHFEVFTDRNEVFNEGDERFLEYLENLWLKVTRCHLLRLEQILTIVKVPKESVTSLSEEDLVLKAKEKFENLELGRFCQSRSIFKKLDYDLFSGQYDDEQDDQTKGPEEYSWCSSVSKKMKPYINIDCRRITDEEIYQ